MDKYINIKYNRDRLLDIWALIHMISESFMNKLQDSR